MLASSTPCGGNEVPLYPNPTPPPTPTPTPTPNPTLTPTLTPTLIPTLTPTLTQAAARPNPNQGEHFFLSSVEAAQAGAL